MIVTIKGDLTVGITNFEEGIALDARASFQPE